jgi:hypothetical protein
MSEELLPQKQEAAAQLLAHGGIEKQDCKAITDKSDYSS